MSHFDASAPPFAPGPYRGQVDLLWALVAIVGLVAVTTVIGLVLRARSGRARRFADPTAADAVDPAELRGAVEGEAATPRLGEQATLLQFSTEFCSRCPATRRTLTAIAEDREGVRHLDVDLTHRPDLAKRFKVLQTPTTLVLDGAGRIRTRFSGAAARQSVETELDRILPKESHV